jgi:hypothetical protein
VEEREEVVVDAFEDDLDVVEDFEAIEDFEVVEDFVVVDVVALQAKALEIELDTEDETDDEMEEKAALSTDITGAAACGAFPTLSALIRNSKANDTTDGEEGTLTYGSTEHSREKS